MELQLTDNEAQRLIAIFKSVIQKHVKILVAPCKGAIHIKAFKENQREFLLSYFYGVGKIQYQFMDERTKHTLIRVNLDNNFHKNADGERIRGHRINIFSEQEFYDKQDGITHYKAFPLPFDTISDTNDFFLMLDNIFQYTNTDKQDNIDIVEPQLLL